MTHFLKTLKTKTNFIHITDNVISAGNWKNPKAVTLVYVPWCPLEILCHSH